MNLDVLAIQIVEQNFDIIKDHVNKTVLINDLYSFNVLKKAIKHWEKGFEIIQKQLSERK